MDPDMPTEKELHTLAKICEIWEKLGKNYRQTLEAWDPITPERQIWKRRTLKGLDAIGR